MEIPFNLDNFKSYYNENDIIKKKNFEDLKKYHFTIADPIEELAIFYYTYDSTSNINNFLRGSRMVHPNVTNETMGTSFRELESYIHVLSNLTSEKQLKEDTILYRGLRETHEIKEIIDNKHFYEKGFSSTSFDKKIALKHSCSIKNGISSKGWIMQIYSPQGTSGIFLEQHSVIPSEMEFLMPNDLTFYLFDIDYEKKRTQSYQSKIFINHQNNKINKLMLMW